MSGEVIGQFQIDLPGLPGIVGLHEQCSQSSVERFLIGEDTNDLLPAAYLLQGDNGCGERFFAMLRMTMAVSF